MGTPLNICNWETGDGAEAALVGTASVVASPLLGKGNYALRVNPTGTGTGYSTYRYANGVSFGLSQIFARTYINIATALAATSEDICSFHDGVLGYKMIVRLTNARVLAAYSSNGTSLLGTGTTVIPLATDTRIEWTCGTGANAPWEVRINGVSEISGTSSNLSALSHNYVRFGKATNRNGNSIDIRYGHTRVDSGSYPGAGVVLPIALLSDGSVLDWTIGAGAGLRWQQIDETPHDSATTYLLSPLMVGAQNFAQLVSYATAGITTAIATYKMMSVTQMNVHNQSGQAKLRVRHGGSNADSGPFVPADPATGLWTNFGYLILVDPSTGVAWDKTATTPEIAIVENTTSGAMRCTYLRAFAEVALASVPIEAFLAPVVLYMRVPAITSLLGVIATPIVDPPSAPQGQAADRLPAGQGNCGGVTAWQTIVS